MTRLLFALAAVLAIVLATSRDARAQAAQLKATVDAQTVEVGDTLAYSLQATTSDGPEPRDAQPGPTAGFQVRMTASGPMHSVTIVNGVQTVSRGLTTTWTLHAERTGTFTLGPASVSIGGARRAANPVRVTVVPKGQAPRRRDRFDPWRSLFDMDDERPPEPPPVPVDPKLALDAPRAPIAFLHATIDKRRAVVGEQVTLTIYLYEDPYARQAQPRDIHEPTATDFVKRPLTEDESRATLLGNAQVGDRQWSVKLIRKTALFPLKSGRLVIEPMSMTLPQARAGLRETERLFVEVTEPPQDGRPAGYALGDVGDMSLSATVTPRTVDHGGAVGVQIELRGTGNLPAQLATPEVQGAEWLDVQVRDKLGAAGNDRYGGTRVFSYVVRLQKEGQIDLGEVRLPFFDPDKRAYGVARASLGIVDVKRGAARDAGVADEDPVLPGLPRERRALEGREPEAFLSDRPSYWALVFGSPALSGLLLVAGGVLRRARARREAASTSPAKLAKDRRAEAEEACKGGDGKAAMGAIARAVEAEVLARTGVNVRGGASREIARELADASVDEARAREIVSVLRACEDARFAPDDVDVAAARETWARAKREVDALGGPA